MSTDTLPTAVRDDRHRIASFNATTQPYPESNLVALIEEQAARTPAQVAILCPHDRRFGVSALTYAALNSLANQLAHRLRDSGVQSGDVVGLLLERSFAMSIGILAVLKAGAAYLPLSPDNPWERNEFMLSDARVTTLLTHGETANRCGFNGSVIDIDKIAFSERPTDDLELPRTPEDLAYVIYTSGSTGRPKGVMIEHRSVVNRLHWMQRAYPLGPADVILQKTPYYFDVSVWELLWWTTVGAQMAFLPTAAGRNPITIVETIRVSGATVLHFVPSMLSVFLEYLDGQDPAKLTRLSSVRRVFASGEQLTAAHVKRFNNVWGERTGARLINLYGPTEATVDVTYFDCPTDGNIDTVPIGRPIDNTRLYVIRDGRETAIGDSGELCIAGVGLARGYINNPALTEQKFTSHPENPRERIYRTGDIARWLPDGNIEYLGREDQQVKIRGLRIELGEIENVARECPGIVDCVVTVQKFSESVILIVAHLVSSNEIDVANLKTLLQARLPDYMIPNRFEQIAEIPLTPSGKADRKALARPIKVSTGPVR